MSVRVIGLQADPRPVVDYVSVSCETSAKGFVNVRKVIVLRHLDRDTLVPLPARLEPVDANDRVVYAVSHQD
jgi:hypothetical protein